MVGIRRCLLVLLGVAAAWGCNQSATEAPKLQPPVVTVAHPIETEIVDNYYYDGYTAAISTVDIKARVTGYLSKVYFKDGDEVKEGAPLFLIDPRPFQADLDRARAELDEVKAQLNRLDADLARAKLLLPKKAIAQEDYDKIVADRGQAQATIKAREAAITQADLNLHYAAIRAPIAGRISRTLVTEGNLVTANMTSLTTIVSIEPMYAYFDVDEPTVLRVQKQIREGKLESARESKMPVHLGLDIDSGYPHVGYIDFVENRVDSNTGTLKLRAVFPNKDRVLTPGLHVRIELPLGKPYKALAISDRAIGSSRGEKFVFLVNDKNQVVQRPVKLGAVQNQLRVVTEGLQASDRVIVNGLQRVRDGVTVNPQVSDATAQQQAPTTKSLADK